MPFPETSKPHWPQLRLGTAQITCNENAGQDERQESKMRTRIVTTAIAAMVVLMESVMAPSAAPADASALFKQLVGSWRGEGDLELEDGTHEKLSCNGYYVLKSEGHGLSIASICNSPKQKFEFRSLVSESGGSISGEWEERTYHATGQVSGTATGTNISLSFTGTIEGKVSIAFAGKTHSINVSAAGSGIKGVSISLARSS
jgi:hypothetical protein